jgi:DNA-binding transcriptional LysR family regulator
VPKKLCEGTWQPCATYALFSGKSSLLSAAVRISQPSLSHAIAQLEQVLGDPFIQYTHGSGLRHVINDMFAQIDASPNVAYEIQEDQVIAGLVAQGFGVSIVPYMEMLLRLNVKILQISRPVPNRIIYLVTDSAMTLSPAVADFKRFVLPQSELA